MIVCAALALHGVAFACFFTTGTLYIESVSPPDIRHSTRTCFGMVLYGIGPALAGPYSQRFDQMVLHTAAGIVPNFAAIWWTQAGIARACALVIAIGFRPVRA